MTVAAIHPGIVGTPMNRGRGDPADAVARDLKRLIDGLCPGDTGRFLARDGGEIPW